ncbi:MAG: N-6 DNA methylase [Pelagibacterales bacterium]|nr:N-6 DNA methylase [Pelagibacterales bacterium]
MSEELSQIKEPITFGRYKFYKLGSTTLSQLRTEKIIKSNFTADISNKKPDGVLILSGGSVKAIVEYKQPKELNSKKLIEKAINQEIEVAKQLCKILIITDGKNSYWINPLNGEEIINENNQKINFVFDLKKDFTKEEIKHFESLVDKIDHSISQTNNKIFTPEIIDPSGLAKTLWQKIYINTGKEPTKCLYNVVELFVFKFLSDIGALNERRDFNAVYSIISINKKSVQLHQEALERYSEIRTEIKKLFPADESGDKTTIINGTIFVNELGKANLPQASLFAEVLEHLQEYDNSYGSFKYIKREFKTRLYETFLRQGAGIKTLGQFFTPRNVVQAMVRMSKANTLGENSRICDPFCGVGGFLLETIVENPNILREFEPKNGIVSPNITLVGYDRGDDEKDQERTIILAKANMLIYLSDLLVKYNNDSYLKAFATGAFNKVFKLIKTNLGTLGLNNEEKFDLILTNPPYITSGSASIKKQIELENLSGCYAAGGRGIESLSIEWIINNLKEGGEALVIVPDGLLNQKTMIDFLFKKCNILGIVSLPVRTFYSTPKKTYILIFRKKFENELIQTTPVFTYLVSEIGESRDSKRFPIKENDLDELLSFYNQFKGSPSTFKSLSKRCKIYNIEEIKQKPNLMVDRFWTEDEKKELGIEDETVEMTEDEFFGAVDKMFQEINSFKDYEKF